MPMEYPTHEAPGLSNLWQGVLASGLVWRARICLATYIVAFIVTLFPVPFVTYDSITQTMLSVLMLPFQAHVFDGPREDGYRIYFQFATVLAAVLASPVLIYHVLALASPSPADRMRRFLTTCEMLLAFIVGLLIGYAHVLPLWISRMFTFSTADINGGIEAHWTFGEYAAAATRLLLCLGLAFQIPAFLAGLAWIGRRSPQ
jgi:sec-independent protein translocase protein TatC